MTLPVDCYTHLRRPDAPWGLPVRRFEIAWSLSGSHTAPQPTPSHEQWRYNVPPSIRDICDRFWFWFWYSIRAPSAPSAISTENPARPLALYHSTSTASRSPSGLFFIRGSSLRVYMERQSDIAVVYHMSGPTTDVGFQLLTGMVYSSYCWLLGVG
jgi:hypothetical protein